MLRPVKMKEDLRCSLRVQISNAVYKELQRETSDAIRFHVGNNTDNAPISRLLFTYLYHDVRARLEL